MRTRFLPSSLPPSLLRNTPSRPATLSVGTCVERPGRATTSSRSFLFVFQFHPVALREASEDGRNRAAIVIIRVAPSDLRFAITRCQRLSQRLLSLRRDAPHPFVRCCSHKGDIRLSVSLRQQAGEQPERAAGNISCVDWALPPPPLFLLLSSSAPGSLGLFSSLGLRVVDCARIHIRDASIRRASFARERVPPLAKPVAPPRCRVYSRSMRQPE